jgi:hypothetical protein
LCYGFLTPSLAGQPISTTSPGPQQCWRFSHVPQPSAAERRESEIKCLPTFPAPNYLIHTSCILFTPSSALTYSMLNRKLSEPVKVHPSSSPDVWPRNVSCKSLLTTERVLQRFESKFKLGTDHGRSQPPGSFNSYSTWISVIVPPDLPSFTNRIRQEQRPPQKQP